MDSPFEWVITPEEWREYDREFPPGDIDLEDLKEPWQRARIRACEEWGLEGQPDNGYLFFGREHIYAPLPLNYDLSEIREEREKRELLITETLDLFLTECLSKLVVQLLPRDFPLPETTQMLLDRMEIPENIVNLNGVNLGFFNFELLFCDQCQNIIPDRYFCCSLGYLTLCETCSRDHSKWGSQEVTFWPRRRKDYGISCNECRADISVRDERYTEQGTSGQQLNYDLCLACAQGHPELIVEKDLIRVVGGYPADEAGLGSVMDWVPVWREEIDGDGYLYYNANPSSPLFRRVVIALTDHHFREGWFLIPESFSQFLNLIEQQSFNYEVAKRKIPLDYGLKNRSEPLSHVIM